MRNWRWSTKSFLSNDLFRPTSKMSHAHGRRACCGLRLLIPRFHPVLLSLARGMTDVGVGSGALLGSGKLGERQKSSACLRAFEVSIPLPLFAEATPEYLDCLTRAMTVSASPAPSFTTPNRCLR